MLELLLLASTALAEEPAYETPWDAYEAGAYEEALTGFVERLVSRPDDVDALIDVASSLHQTGAFAEAGAAFQQAAAAATSPEDQARALYGLGNTAYRSGQLEQAVQHYEQALEQTPDDEDIKHNLEFVRQEIERREQEQEQQQNNDNQDGEDGEDSQDNQDNQDQDQDQDNQDQDQQPSEQDGDGDGLSDEQEQQASNPTDPANPDSDGDGLSDGQEDANHNGQVDPGETDPNNPDSDGDGITDGAEQTSGPPMTPEQALQWLGSLEEERPEEEPQGNAVAAPPGGKDW